MRRPRFTTFRLASQTEAAPSGSRGRSQKRGKVILRTEGHLQTVTRIRWENYSGANRIKVCFLRFLIFVVKLACLLYIEKKIEKFLVREEKSFIRSATLVGGLNFKECILVLT